MKHKSRINKTRLGEQKVSEEPERPKSSSVKHLNTDSCKQLQVSVQRIRALGPALLGAAASEQRKRKVGATTKRERVTAPHTNQMLLVAEEKDTRPNLE